jgi:hypothetical protein
MGRVSTSNGAADHPTHLFATILDKLIVVWFATWKHGHIQTSSATTLANT